MADVQPAPHAPTHASVAEDDVTLVPSERAGARAATAQRALALGVALLLVAAGVAGFVVTGVHDWTGRGRTLAGIGVNPLHNLLHLALGAAGLVLWRRPAGVRGYGLLLALVDAALLVYGLVAQGAAWDLLDVTDGDLVGHLVVAVAGLAVAAWPRPRRRPRRRPVR